MNLRAISIMAVLASPVGLRAQGVSAGTRQGTTPKQHFVCNTGYTLEKCHVEMDILRKVLAKYPTAALGEWSWVLVRSEDWKTILLSRQFDPNSPAFSFLPASETFFDEALMLPVSNRGAELSAVWHMPVEELLDLSVRHELGHAVCNERDERQADHVAAALLRDSRRISCNIAAIPALNESTHLPVILDPSHATGKRSLLPAVSRAGEALGVDRLIVEVHPAPEIGSALGGPVQGQELNKPETAVAVPFDLVSNFLVVARGQAGSLDGLKFIVDTGATRSVVDRKVAIRLRLKRHPGRIMNFDRYIPIEWAELAELRMGPIRAEHLRVMVVNLGEYSEFGKSADGIIGLDLLSNSEKFTIDYGEKNLYFEPAANGNHRPVPGSFIVPIVVQGAAMRLVVDTGLSEILLFGDRLKRRPIKIRTEGEPETVAMGRIGGTRVILPGAQIGGPEESIAVVLINGPGERMLPGLDGFLGTSSLHTKHIEFDFDKMILRWQ